MKKYWKAGALVVLVAAASAFVSYVTVSRYGQRLDARSASVQSEIASPAERQVQLVKSEAPASGPVDFTVAAENSVHAVVHIMSKSTRMVQSQMAPQDLFDYFFGYRSTPRQIQPQPQVGYGSGVIISRDGFIITNNHVIEGADEIEVTLNDHRSYPAKIIGTDPVTDVSLIKIEEENLPTIPFGNSEDLKVGEWVLAIGNPLNLTSTVTAGIVSAKGRNLGRSSYNQNGNGQQSLSIESFIQTDAAVNPGNSGGALVNTKGELVGINTAIVSTSGAFSGYSFAIPSVIFRKVVADLKEYGSVQRALLGVVMQTMTSDLAKEKKIDMTEGAYVVEVKEHSGAQEAGIKEGDIITQVEDRTITSSSELTEQMTQYRPGDEIKVTVVRGKKSEVLKVKLYNADGNTNVVRQQGMEVLGAAFGELTPAVKKQLNISYGIQVSGLTDGKMKDAGIRKGFIIMKVNDQKIGSVSDFEKIVRYAQSDSEFGEKALFIVGLYPNGKLAYYAIDLSE